VKHRNYLGDGDVVGSVLLGEDFKAVREHSLKTRDGMKILLPSFLISLLDGANDLPHAIGPLYPAI
jgi:hypothetical protein